MLNPPNYDPSDTTYLRYDQVTDMHDWVRAEQGRNPDSGDPLGEIYVMVVGGFSLRQIAQRIREEQTADNPDQDELRDYWRPLWDALDVTVIVYTQEAGVHALVD